MNPFHSQINHNNSKLICFNRKDTINELIGGKSFIRFGDGEYKLMKGGNIGFQKKNQAFKEIFETILKNPDKLNYIIGLYLKTDWKHHINILLKIYDSDKIYHHDALIFRSRKEPKIYVPLFNYLERCVF